MDHRHGIHRVTLFLISFMTGMTIILNFFQERILETLFCLHILSFNIAACIA